MISQAQQDVCCLMGQPVAGNPRHYMLETAFAHADLDWRFLTFEVIEDDFARALDGARVFGFRGVMLAPPHRETALELVDELTEQARVSGSVNCLQLTEAGLLGHNTEGASLRKLAEQTTYLEGSSVVILGGGRWARSIAAEMALAGVEELTLVYQEVEPLQEFVNALVEQTPLANCFVAPWPAGEPLEIPENCSLLVNATKIGRMSPEKPLPIVIDSLSPSVTVADVVFNPTDTWLLRQAADRDCPTIDGLTLLVEQAAAAFEIWTGQDADRDAMREAVEEFLAL